MTRGKKPAAAIRDAKKFAEKMGYRWQENMENPDLGYDLQVFKPGYAILVKIRVLRNHISPNVFYEDLLEDDLREVRALPFPPWMPPRSGSALNTSGPGDGSGSTISRLPRSNGGNRTGIRTRTPGRG